MSICRWSSDNFRSDLYCYEGEGGYITHVARSRYVGDIPVMPHFPAPGEDCTAWFAAHDAQSKWLDTADSEPIGGPHDGESFTDETAQRFRERLLELRAAGYRFPDYVLDVAEDDMADAIT